MAMTPKHIVYERTREVYQFMRDGSKQTKDVLHFFSEKWTADGFFDKDIKPMSKHRTVFNYMKKVRQTFMNFESDVEIEKGRVLSRLDDLYTKSLKIQDYKGSLAVLKVINEMLGLNEPEKIEHSLNNDVIILPSNGRD